MSTHSRRGLVRLWWLTSGRTSAPEDRLLHNVGREMSDEHPVSWLGAVLVVMGCLLIGAGILAYLASPGTRWWLAGSGIGVSAVGWVLMARTAPSTRP